MKTVFIQISTVVILVIVVVLTFYSDAGAVHKGAGGLTCGNCHTMHNSQGSTTGNDGNAPLGGNVGGSLMLLRGPVSSRENIHKLCLQCHASNGSQANTSHAPQNVVAPKVYSSGTWNDTMGFNQISAGGDFFNELSGGWDALTPAALGYGHSIGATNVVPPGGDTALSRLTCTSCHDPHGAGQDTPFFTTKTNLYRNLWVSPTDAGTNIAVNLVPFKLFTDNPGAWWNLNFATTSYVGAISVGDTAAPYFGGAETDAGGNVIWPVYRGVLTGNETADYVNSNAYGRSAKASYPMAGYGPLPRNIGMGYWCAQCHDNWHEGIVPNNRVYSNDPSYAWSWGERHRNRHPVAGMIPGGASPGCADSCHYRTQVLDRAMYDTTIIQAGKGVPVTASIEYMNYTYSPGGARSTVFYLPPCNIGVNCSGTMTLGEEATVFCLTCHFAHAGPYMDALRWDYTLYVGSGSQTGNPIASTKGCQLCHNR